MKAPLLAAALLLLFFGSLAAAGDIAPPVLVDASADRLQIDTSAAPQTITLTLHITDDLAGVRWVQVGFRHEHGYNDSRECQRWLDVYERDAWLLCAVTWPQYSAEGRWMVTWLSMVDGVGNATDGNVARCLAYADGRCQQFVYGDDATAAVRALEVQIGAAQPGGVPPVFLPLLIR